MKIIVYGATSAGLAAAGRLRRLDERARIVVADPRRTAPGLQRACAVYNLIPRMYADAVWPSAAPGMLPLADELTGAVVNENYDALIIAHNYDESVFPLVCGGDNVFNLSDISRFDAQWQCILHRIARDMPQTAVVCGDDMVAAMAAGRLLSKGIGVTINAQTAVVPTDIDYDIACHITAHLVKNGVQILESADTADMTINCRQIALPGLPVYTATDDAAARKFPLDNVAKSIFNGLLVDVPNMAAQKGRAIADAVMSRPHDAAHNTSINLRQFEIFGKDIAMLGLDENELNHAQMPYIYTVVPTPGGFLKLIFNSKGDILGFAAIGQDASHYANIVAVFARLGRNIFDITRIEMTDIARPVQVLAKTSQNVLEKRLLTAYWDEIVNVDLEKTVLMDVRPPALFHAKTITGAINMPLATLRENLDVFDTDKEIIVFCDSGEDSYLAALILSGKVPNLRHLGGGLDYFKHIKAEGWHE